MKANVDRIIRITTSEVFMRMATLALENKRDPCKVKPVSFKKLL